MENLNSYVTGSATENISLYQQVVNLYHSLCPSLAKVSKATETRKEALKDLLDTYCIEDIKTVFEKAEALDFMTGRLKGYTWKATFDWLIKKENFVKVLEDKYINQGQAQKTEAKKSNYDFDSMQKKAFLNVLNFKPMPKKNVVEAEEEKENIYTNHVTFKRTLSYQQVIDLYHSLCPSLERVIAIGKNAKKDLDILFNRRCGKEVFEMFFEKVEASDILTGRKYGNIKRASFDWLVQMENFIKILKGDYDNK